MLSLRWLNPKVKTPLGSKASGKAEPPQGTKDPEMGNQRYRIYSASQFLQLELYIQSEGHLHVTERKNPYAPRQSVPLISKEIK